MRSALSAACLATMVLAGCGATPPNPAATVPAGEAGAERDRAAPVATPPRTARAVVPPPKLTPEELDPERLLRMPRDRVASLLGDPGFVRREASARVWQYRTQTCVLDLFLYDESAELRVVYYEFRPANSRTVSVDDCFEALLVRKRQTAES